METTVKIFKVGDQARIVKRAIDGAMHAYHIGEIVTIVKNPEDIQPEPQYVHCMNEKGLEQFCHFSDLERI